MQHRFRLAACAAVFGFTVLMAVPAAWADDPADAIAQFRIGYAHERGDHMKVDYAEAMRLYRLSAAQGNPVAQFRIGYLYEKGLGVAEDDAQAMQWYEKAAAQNNEPAISRLAVLKAKYPG
jgi:TPR repeat protein